ncbi:hypothetical protein QYE76_008314 [Lolium multiflorum]|uniref:Transposase (putative) gypsy type domain-containing protein n=1 Tax=Lolium multiflorum TaxID=4521 RepID=A0AAD8UZF3_LOLMU|nr:hypothetical protein QYE76_008314 [Lolium multiflorum]
MSSSTPPPTTEPIAATPISSAPPPFITVQLEPSKDSGKIIEGTSANPEDTVGAKQMEKKAKEAAAKKSKARKRDDQAKGKWWPCFTSEIELRNLEAERFIKPGSWRRVSGELNPAPEAGERVVTKALIERGFSLPPSDFFSEILKAYELQPHHIAPNSILAISNHVALCEGHLRLRPGRTYPHTDRHESVRYWSGNFFYLKDVSDPASSKVLPDFKDGPPSETPAWTQCPHLSESPQLTREVRRIHKLMDEGLSGKDLTMSWFTKRIQPLQHRDHLLFQYTGREDNMRASKDNLFADALDKRLRVLIKIPRELKIHVCNMDIHTNGSGTALEALEEKDLGTLLRVPQTGNTDPEAASEAEATEAPGPSKRKRTSSSGPAAKCAREVPSTAATRKAEAEKKRLKLIDTSNRAQPNIQQFFIPTGSGSQPPKIARKKVKPSPAYMPVTPEVEVAPKVSSTTKPDPKVVINVDDLPEDPTTESGKGDPGKGASSPAPPPEHPTATSTEAPADKVERKLTLSGATGTPQTHPHFFPILQKVPLSQRHAEISAMMEQVWGPANTEEQELTELEGGIKAFFAKHKNVRQNTRKLHEDLRTHVLEQKKEIKLLQTRDAESQKAIALLETHLKGYEDEIAKRPSIDALSAKVEVLEAENKSLKNFLKESSDEETKKRKELLEKHAQEVSDLAEKLKKSQQRIQTLASKNKNYEAEAEAIDKMIFPSLGFEWTKDATLKRTEAYEEAQNSIDNLFEACRGVAKSLSLKRAGTAVIDTMTKLMKQVPELIKDWQESSARGVASLVLATCKAHFPTMNFADVARGAPKGTNMRVLLAETQGYDRLFVGRVNHSFWYNKHDLPAGFSDAEDEDEEDCPEDFVEEGSGSSADHEEEGSGDDSAMAPPTLRQMRINPPSRTL